MRTTVSTKGQIIIPAEIRAEDAIMVGDAFEVKKIRKGEYLICRIEEAPNEGLVDWLLACPIKGYFEPIRSERTDTV
jgi:AbrB family looped-hinge helix DNA binding protein